MSQREIRGVTLQIGGETGDTEGYSRCIKCNSKTLLVSALGEWEVDEECFKSGEDTPEGTPDAVFIGEISGHWCPECVMLVSLSYNFE